MTDETKTREARIRDGDVRGAVARLRAKIGDLPVAMVTATDSRLLAHEPTADDAATR